MANPQHHPEEAFLVDYAAGALDAPFAALVAAHLTLCPACRREVELLEGLGGEMLYDLAPADLGDTALADTMALLDRPAEMSRPKPVADLASLAGLGDLPQPFQDVLRAEVARRGRKALRWRPLSLSLSQMLLRPSPGGGTLRFIRARGGACAPRHDHAGIEMSFVLAGGFTDAASRYGVGDFVAVEPGTSHRPVADAEGCVFAWASGGPIILPGLLGLLMKPFLR